MRKNARDDLGTDEHELVQIGKERFQIIVTAVAIAVASQITEKPDLFLVKERSAS